LPLYPGTWLSLQAGSQHNSQTPPKKFSGKQGLLRNTMVDASCIQIKPRGNPRGILKSTVWHYTGHCTIWPNKTIASNKLLSFKPRYFHHSWASWQSACPAYVILTAFANIKYLFSVYWF